MATNSVVSINGSSTGNALQELLNAGDIEPGAEPSYQLCKTIYLYHPFGAKMVEKPIKIAQSQPRVITITDSPGEMVLKAYNDEWKALGADNLIFNAARQARIYGISAIVYGAEGVPPTRPLKPEDMPDLNMFFNVLDPLNTAGSLVLNQDPNSESYQRPRAVSANGIPYHPSRTCVVMNEQPIYIAYTSAAFGFSGRSVYQRALFPLKSFLQSMLTDDLVTRKAGVLVAMLKQPGAIIDSIMQKAASLKRAILQEAETNNVINIAVDEKIESINLVNTDTAMTTARKNIIENIATAADMPAKMLNSESFAEGFGEGTEDAKDFIRYIKEIREWLGPLYDFFDRIVQYRAWTPEFFENVKAAYPELYGNMGYAQAFYKWRNSFESYWPSLMEEPESELIKVEDTKLKAIIGIIEAMMPTLDPENKARLIQWAQDNVNEMDKLFPNALDLDIDALMEYEPPTVTDEPEPKDKLKGD